MRPWQARKEKSENIVEHTSTSIIIIDDDRFILISWNTIKVSMVDWINVNFTDLQLPITSLVVTPGRSFIS